MNDKTADILFKIGRILLVVMMGLYVLSVILNLNTTSSMAGTLISALVVLAILISAFFEVKKHPTRVGAWFLGYGIFLFAWILYSSRLKWSLPNLIYACLPAWFLIADGALFLANGLLRRRNKGNVLVRPIRW